MSAELLEQHQKHKERQLRIKAAAARLAKPAPAEPTPEPQPAPEKKIIEVNMPRPGVGVVLDIVIEEVCAYYKVELHNIFSNRRINNIVIPRHMISYMVYKLTDFTTHQVARKLNRDPTTIGYAIHRIEEHLELHKEAIEALAKTITERLANRKTVFVT